jgi:hypothetical protein
MDVGYPIIAIVILAAVAVFIFIRKSSSVPQGEVDAHDASRFARLLVTNIKLYEGRKLEQGLLQSDIYGSLRTEIDEARTSFAARVPAPELAHCLDDQLVDMLAGGDPQLMGSDFVHSRKY